MNDTYQPSSSDISERPEAAPTLLRSAQLEVLLSVWRIMRAVVAFPESPSERVVLQWNHGIARELWCGISALGLQEASRYVADNPEPRSQCEPLALLLSHTQWTIRRGIVFDIATFDRHAFTESIDLPTADFAALDATWGRPHWWVWGPNGPATGRCPHWWLHPTAEVCHPVPMHISDVEELIQDSETIEARLRDMTEARETVIQSFELADDL